MGVFDNVMAGLGRGVNAADRKSQELKIQSELSTAGKQKAALFEALGRAVYADEAGGSAFLSRYEDQVLAIKAIEQQEAALAQQLAALKQPAVPSQPMTDAVVVQCPSCGAYVDWYSQFCERCGAPIPHDKPAAGSGAAGSDNTKYCANCGVYYPADTVFCERCGARVSDVAPVEPVSEGPRCPSCGAALEEGALFCMECGARIEAPASEPEPAPAPAGPVCPSCGAPLEEGALFCGECGTKLEASVVPMSVPEPEPEPTPVSVLEPEPEPESVSEGPRCRVCGAPLEAGALFCGECGTKVEAPAPEPDPEPEPEPAVPVCRVCGAPLVEGALFCGECGAKVEAPAAPVAPEPEPAVPVCPACGAPLVEGALFCGECGIRL